MCNKELEKTLSVTAKCVRTGKEQTVAREIQVVPWSSKRMEDGQSLELFPMELDVPDLDLLEFMPELTTTWTGSIKMSL